MIDNRSTNPSGKPTTIEKIVPWLLVIPSALIGILMVELASQLFCPSIRSTETVYKAVHRVIFFDGRTRYFEIKERYSPMSHAVRSGILLDFFLTTTLTSGANVVNGRS
jgi:hypothetical protein